MFSIKNLYMSTYNHRVTNIDFFKHICSVTEAVLSWKNNLVILPIKIPICAPSQMICDEHVINIYNVYSLDR